MRAYLLPAIPGSRPGQIADGPALRLGRSGGRPVLARVVGGVSSLVQIPQISVNVLLGAGACHSDCLLLQKRTYRRRYSAIEIVI